MGTDNKTLMNSPTPNALMFSNGIVIRAGRSPTFQDPGTPVYGPVSPIEEVLSFKTRAFGEFFYVDPYPRVSLGLAGTP